MSQCGSVCRSERGSAQCGRVSPNVGECPSVEGCIPVSEGVPQCGRVCPSMGECDPVCEDATQCGRVCPSVDSLMVSENVMNTPD